MNFQNEPDQMHKQCSKIRVGYRKYEIREDQFTKVTEFLHLVFRLAELE